MYYLILPTMLAAVLASSVVSSTKTEPTWHPDQVRSSFLSDKGFCRLESVTLDELAARGGAAAMPAIRYGDLLNGVPYAGQDGGLLGYLGPRYRFQPRTLDGGQWRYGRVVANGTALSYICLDATATGVTDGTFRALLDMQAKLPAGRFFIGSACGSLTNTAAPSVFPAPVAVTLTVIPGTRVTTSCSEASTSNGNSGNNGGGNSGTTTPTNPTTPSSPTTPTPPPGCKEKPGNGHNGNQWVGGKNCSGHD